ncbi:MAG TPA: aquaporin [Candidatus Saccharimonadales bacterium]|jgi:glycerol uptake facilitator-like aquaporin|nr:aquaporin [Candidatus Saccharimonadales bacterium]
MATKKAVSTTKKPIAKKPVAKNQTSTKVTTLKAVESRPAHSTAAAASVKSRRFGLVRTPLAAALVAEFVGTFIFAAVLIAGQGQPILALFALVGIVLAVGSFSGGYLNPALVVGAWATRRMSGLRAAAYIVAQILGAMLALVILNGFLNGVGAQAGTNGLSQAPTLFKAATLPEGKEWFIFLAEFLGTLIFAFAAANAFREVRDRTAKAFTLGLGVFLGLMVAGSVAAFFSANAILNPAVAISLQAITFDSVWPIAVYVIGSILGAVAGFGLYQLVENAQKDTIA